MERPPHLYGTYADGAFLPPPFDPQLWADFLVDRGVDIDALRCGEAVRGGLINGSYRLVDDNAAWFLRWYRQREFPAVVSELELVSRLATQGFPTPPPVAATDGALAEVVVGWPAALFPFVAGARPAPGVHYCRLRDLPLAGEVAHTMGLLGSVTAGLHLSGERLVEPASRVDAYVRRVRDDDQLLAVAGMAELLDLMSEALDAFRAVAAPDLPAGVVHNDVNPDNVLVDAHERLLWILDFDDARNAPLVYELVALFPYWARGSIESLDGPAIRRLVAEYERARPLSDSERSCLVEAALLHQASEVCSHFGHHEIALRAGRETLGDSYSYALLNGMKTDTAWSEALN